MCSLIQGNLGSVTKNRLIFSDLRTLLIPINITVSEDGFLCRLYHSMNVFAIGIS